MMKKKTIVSLVFLLITFAFIMSCGNSKEQKDMDIVTERIQYDVPVKAPYPDLDWWVMNIEGAKREKLVNMILNMAYEGKVQAYNYLDMPMTAEEVRAIGVRNDTLIMPSMHPPYDDSVVVINERLRVNDINRLRFLEEWQINKKTMKIEKNVLGLALVLTDYAPNGELRGYKPLFWVYFDDRYPIQ